ncbi:hypothetical protein HPB47_003713, partial [Ixodes persulcatus]
RKGILVKWKGYPKWECTFEPRRHLNAACLKELEQPRKPSPERLQDAANKLLSEVQKKLANCRSSFSGEDAASQVRTLIERGHSVGLQVVAITSDMGSGDRAMWKQFGVHAGRYSRTVNLIPHPQVPGEQIAFLADVPHLIKNLNGHLVRGQTITLPADVVAANGLPCSSVLLEPVRQLAEFEKNLTFKMAPKLRPELLDPNHFEKMKASTALPVLSHSTATALRFLVENSGWSTNFLATAWFLEQVNKWFDLMSSRHPVLVISRQNEACYKNTLDFLVKFKDLFLHLTIGDGAFKPVQAGGNPIPTLLEFKMALKIITLSQYLKASKAGSYELDDASFYLADLADLDVQPAVPTDIFHCGGRTHHVTT